MATRYPIIQLSWKDKSAFISLMANAFSPDPLFNKLFIHNQTPLAATNRVKAFLSFMFDMSMLGGSNACGIFDGDRLTGCYLLEVPGKNSFLRVMGTILTLIRALVLPFQISVRSFKLVNDYMRITRATVPHGRHYYLAMIGVHETARGQGFGKALMQDIIGRVEHDEQAVGISLDTENCANVGFYEHFGFALQKEVCLDGLAVYCMLRKQVDGFGVEKGSIEIGESVQPSGQAGRAKSGAPLTSAVLSLPQRLPPSCLASLFLIML